MNHTFSGYEANFFCLCNRVKNVLGSECIMYEKIKVFVNKWKHDFKVKNVLITSITAPHQKKAFKMLLNVFEMNTKVSYRGQH